MNDIWSKEQYLDSLRFSNQLGAGRPSSFSQGLLRRLGLAGKNFRKKMSANDVHDVFGYMSEEADCSVLPKRVAIGISSLGNFFMAEIAYMLEDAFRKLAVTTRLFAEHEASAVADFETILIVAPHEFFLLGEGPLALRVLRHVPALVMFNVEQRQTQWFRTAQRYLPKASAVLDINYHTACHLAQAGYKSFFFPLGYSEYFERRYDGRMMPEHELFKHLPAPVRESLPASYAERPIDILFIGAASPRRHRFFAQNAAYFAGRNCFLYLPETDRPFLGNEARTIDFAGFVSLVKRSKLLLNVHQDPDPFLEWQRIVNLGILQRTLVVTDHCQPGPCIEPNLDYLDGSLEELPGLCQSALDDLANTEQIAESSYKKIRDNYPIEDVLTKCWTALVKETSSVVV